MPGKSILRFQYIIDRIIGCFISNCLKEMSNIYMNVKYAFHDKVTWLLFKYVILSRKCRQEIGLSQCHIHIVPPCFITTFTTLTLYAMFN